MKEGDSVAGMEKDKMAVLCADRYRVCRAYLYCSWHNWLGDISKNPGNGNRGGYTRWALGAYARYSFD